MLGLVAVVAAVYFLSLRNGFVWDDPLVLIQIRAIKDWTDLVVMPDAVTKTYYRPVVFITYLVDRALGGENPFWFHLSVVGFHAVNTLLVFRLGANLFVGQWEIAVVAAALFAVLPTHVESVAWMAGRSDVLACTFLLLSTLLFMESSSPKSAWIGGAMLFFAVLAKETAVVGIVLIPAMDWLRSRRWQWPRYVPLLLSGAGYFALRLVNAGAVVAFNRPPTRPLELLPELVRALGFYLFRTIAPFSVAPFVPTVPDAPLNLATGALAPIVIGALVVRRWPVSRWPLGYLLAWFTLTLLPAFVIVATRLGTTAVADRYLYIPSVASCALIAWAIWSLAASRGLRPFWYGPIAVVLCGALAIRSAAYSRTWEDNVTFWTTIVTQLPDNAMAQRELGSEMLGREDLPGAERLLKRSLELPSDNPGGRAMALSELALIYRRQGRFAEALDALHAALSVASHPALYHNLGLILMSKAEDGHRRGVGQADVIRDLADARKALETALSLGSSSYGREYQMLWYPAKTHALLGQVLYSTGDRAGAREHLQASLQIEPTGPGADALRGYLQRIGP